MLFRSHYAETSVRQAGKVSFLQDDNRSWKGKDQRGIDTGYYPEPADFIRQLRRTLARRICGDDLFYMMDLLGGNYNDPQVEAELQQHQKYFEQYADLRGPSLGEVLVVVDETAIAHLSLGSQLQKQNVYLQSVEWARMGVPFHVMLLDDAATINLDPYKFVIMTNAYVASPQVVQLVTRCRQEQRSLLFLPGCGLAGPHGPSPETARSLLMFSPGEIGRAHV